MSDRPIMEEMLGATIGRDESRIPGSIPVEKTEFRYYSGSSEGDPKDSFLQFLR